ncbi:phosphoenolpyruvate--protein phosphotransferase [Gynuella sunshinyii]|uniref:phosphoenolpyruvate--protein phosphotransferase n=1 Tax=Gynuella sunshinyii YC6258 TaxID=1445510 RepID=A0A0C5VK93_9GAMM|nr:phosphoenolpyruvate--protein phosphotransferase [Gynuella sunshinyii]AJQ95112.1 phosphoenolpyruvate-protein kinase (PTS system EI component in bacteria) [Gynuella sunshinyii YC6258]
MLKLTPQDITLTAIAENKQEAIALIAERMVGDGLVEPAYQQGMLDREQQTSTYLGNGIAIPHGTIETRDLVRQTGLRVVRFPNGVKWGEDGQVVYTAVGIAAKSDEHLTILRQLTHVIADEALSRRLHTTESADEVRRILSGEALAGSFVFTANQVRLKSGADSYTELTALAGAVLWNAKALTQQELASVYARNPFYLGEGVWVLSVSSQAENGAAAVVQPEQTISLYGESLNTLIAISTHDNQHLPLLEKLTELKLDGGLKKLAACKRSVDVIRLLISQSLAGQQVVCPLPIAHGLHARPAAALARIAKQYDAEIWIENLDSDSPAVSARSVTKLISLGAQLGHRLQITVDDAKADSILEVIAKAIAGGLGDPVVRISSEPHQPAKTETVVETVKPGDQVYGLTGAPGVAIAPAYVVSEPDYQFEHHAVSPEAELVRFHKALSAVSVDLKNKLDKTANTELAQIISMHLELLLDPEMKQETEKFIAQGDSAEWGWKQSFEALASLQEQSQEVLLAERAIDIRDVGNRVLGKLTGQESAGSIEADHVLVCQEIAPSEISELDASVKAVVTAAGGVTSHAAILARSLGIPLLVGCGAKVLTITDGTDVIVDCEAKVLTVAPNADTVAAAKATMAREQKLNEEAYKTRFEPAVTTDGHHVEVMANLTAAKGVEKAVELGCEGVGLFRSEFIYMDHPQEPTIEQQQAEYARVLDGLGEGKPLIVRTLDIGGDKPLPYMPMDEEENPFLGLRGIRLSLRYPRTLIHQLHALLRAAAGRPLRIMFPMVTDIQEWRDIKALFDQVVADYPDAQVELGIMIEVPSAAMMADIFAREVDFFSVGTNDLTQYALAIDRGHPELSRQADSIHPAVLRLIDTTVRAAQQHGIWVGVCGELASDPLGAAILTGLGVRELSMSTRAMARVKAHIRGFSLTQTKELAQRALAAENSAAVRALSVNREADHV